MPILPYPCNNCTPCLMHYLEQPKLPDTFEAVALDEHTTPLTVGAIYFIGFHLNDHQPPARVNH